MAKALFDDDAEEYRSRNAKPKIEYDKEAELLAIAWRRLVAFARSNYELFMQCLTENEELFRYHTTEADREFLRGICQQARDNHMMQSKRTDTDYFDSLFGYYIPSSGPMAKGEQKAPRIQRELEYFGQVTYEGFWKWISNPDVVKRLKASPNLKERLAEVIANQKFENRRTSEKRKGYEPSDEVLFAEVLS